MPSVSCDGAADREMGQAPDHLVEGPQSIGVDGEDERLTDDAVGRAHLDEHAPHRTDRVDRGADRRAKRHLDQGRVDALDLHGEVATGGSSGRIWSSRRISAGHSCLPSGKWSYWRFDSSQMSVGPGSMSRPLPCALSRVRQPRIR